MVSDLKKDERILIIKLLYTLIIFYVNFFLIMYLSRINNVYEYILGVPNTIILLFLLMYAIILQREIIKNKRLGIV